ncbi:Piso0_000621 [Millerozyma farinosa CBS 7064]|uniref:Copper transport protein n=1 Tax=Pichia sorbitophila (strain ATCC MYA-4447 / BCRC 22081 / CBS 7064 / NBRC 10061 / NRRL Y-12695) TaxID=559304 RepID=G8YR22_PICSO|nr:Piso0_000621 [Millerozyma farinosa CBS 7064]
MLPEQLVDRSLDTMSKMSMGGSSTSKAHTCKISMLWNWYTIDTCFIARSWHVKSRGMFAGSCIGVFFLVLASQWLHRFAREYDLAIVRKQEARMDTLSTPEDSESSVDLKANMSTTDPLVHAMSHVWMVKSPSPTVAIRPNFVEHIIRTIIFTVEWGLSYIIMLLFMYYNGYIIISCILGALFGRFIFTYNEAMSCRGENRAGLESDELDRKCCR